MPVFFAMRANFYYDSEFLLSKRIFAMIAKITVHSEIFYFCFCDPNDSVFGVSHFYPHCNYSSLVILVFHVFVRLSKPL